MFKKISEYFKYKKEDKQEFIAVLNNIVQQISIAQQEYIDVFKNKEAYVDVRHINDWKNKFSRLHDEATSYLKDGMIEKKKLPKQYEEPLYKIAKMYTHIDRERDIHNQSILSSHKEKAIEAFAKVSPGTPTDYQINAILSEDRRILITGAPSTGKTAAMNAKIEYLKAQGLKPDSDIVVLCGSHMAGFAQLAAEILKECGIDTEYKSVQKSILPDMIKSYLKEKCNDSSYRSRLVDYYLKYHCEGHTVFDFETRADYDKFITLCPPVSLAGEHLKSYEELDIANFLFSLGVKYEYKAPFKEEVMLNGSRTRYKPDFTLPDYNICINIIEINQWGEAPFEEDTSALSDNTEQIHFAHEEAEIPLIECYSHEKQSGNMLPHLQAALSRYNVEFNIRTDAELIDKILATEPDLLNILAESIQCSVETILASGQSEEIILNASRTKSKTAAPLYKRRERMMSLVMPFYNHYISAVKYDDFRIVWRCANVVSDFSGRLSYKYIFIDEAENLNAASARLISNIVANTGCKIVVCGCGWLSAIGQNGADPVYLQDFGRFFPGFAEIVCDRVFALPKGIYVKMRDFALNNTGNIEFSPNFAKEDSLAGANSDVPGTIEKYDVHYDNEAFLEENFLSLLASFDEKTSVLIACRYNFEAEFFADIASKSNTAAAVDCSTAFNAQSKYDVVIWTNTKYTTFGFPDERICLNNLTDLLLHRPDSPAYAGERNLLCKAVSLTKGRFILLVDQANLSDFVAEL